MAVQVVGGSLMTSDQTEHQAKSVGDSRWVVSYLPGRTLSLNQAVAALRAADHVVQLQACAASLGLTALEAARLASTERPWPPPHPPQFSAWAMSWAGVSR